jgi:K+-transporting ATPase c subunit
MERIAKRLTFIAKINLLSRTGINYLTSTGQRMKIRSPAKWTLISIGIDTEILRDTSTWRTTISISSAEPHLTTKAAQLAILRIGTTRTQSVSRTIRILRNNIKIS